MFVSIKRLLATNQIRRSIGYCQKVEPLITAEEVIQRKKKELFNALVSMLGNRTCLSVDEWKEFRSQAKMHRLLTKDTNILNAIKSLDISQDPLSIAESFVQAFNVNRNVVINCAFIDLYAAKAAVQKLSQSEETELIKLCNEFVQSGMCLMPEISGSVFNGLLATSKWKWIVRVPSMYKARTALNSLIRKAMQENETELVSQLIESISFHRSRDLLPETMENYLNYLAKQNTLTLKYVQQILRFLEQTERIIFEPVAEALIENLQRSNCEVKRIRMDSSGKCPNCEQNLAQSLVTDEEFRLMRDCFESEMLCGKQNYPTQTLDDWSGLRKFIALNGPFDVVVDGMNVAMGSLCDDWRETGRLQNVRRKDLNELINSVKQIEEEGKKVLVIGTGTLERFRGMYQLKSVTSNIFSVENKMNDDIVLLYGAMLSGPNTYILTNDFMRDHKTEMSEKCRTIFSKWRHHRTLGYNFSDYCEFQKIQPLASASFCHGNDDRWHVPFISNEERNQFNWHDRAKHWLCIRV